MPKCIILRGMSGSGKSTLAKEYEKMGYKIVSADNYFIRDGVYKFNQNEIAAAHKDCREQFSFTIFRRKPVVVDNTNLAPWEWNYYHTTAKKNGYLVRFINVETSLSDEELSKRNVHSVPVAVIARQRERMKAYNEQAERLNFEI